MKTYQEPVQNDRIISRHLRAAAHAVRYSKASIAIRKSRPAIAARNSLAVAMTPPYAMPGHYYSPLSGHSDYERAIEMLDDGCPALDLNEGRQRDLAKILLPMLDELPTDRYAPNDMYPVIDAAVYSAMLRTLRPARIVEVGSGYSTAVALDAVDRWLAGTKITCIEPYPARLLAQLRPTDNVDLFEVGVQQVPLKLFMSLEPGDILFIDSTHVAKAGSDVIWLFLHVLPRLRAGVTVHVHDIFWPLEYPQEWLRERRDWNESYLLHAFLAYNKEWSIELFGDWLFGRLKEDLIEAAPRLAACRPASLWISRTGAGSEH
ncbi:class I SAM-dependent methyltransferase [Parafrankia sp. FMc6]|uniref:class I SAM-dependent methyltransferase n=1 Tax=Parafrankia soli TaxID=2599596 RepID=UPI0034D40E8A